MTAKEHNMTVVYEWDVEEYTDDEHEDIVQHYFCTKFSEALAISQAKPEDGCKRRVVLVRDDDYGRSWAYLNDDGTMPERFENADGVEESKVPQRFVREVRAQADCHKCNGNSVTHSALCPKYSSAAEAASLAKWRETVAGAQ